MDKKIYLIRSVLRNVAEKTKKQHKKKQKQNKTKQKKTAAKRFSLAELSTREQ